MAGYEALLEPFQLKHLTLRNRIMSTSHAPAYAEDGMPAERYQLYHQEKAKGGIGLTMFGGSSTISPDCPATFGQIDISGDRVVPHLRKFAERVHGEGAALMCQISHMGRRTRWDSGDWLPPISSSPVREPEHRSFPKEMEDWDFERVIGDFGQAARRCRDGGLDGVELSFCGTHLIEQFWSPLFNKREDEYGGSLENRMRFSFEVLDEVRRQVGGDYIVSVRITGDELIEGGLGQEDVFEIVGRLAESGKMDVLNVMHAQAQDYISLATAMANMSFPVAPWLYLASAIKARVDIPVFHAGRITDLATAARAIEEGHVDMVAMTRPHMADPHIVNKLREGRPEDVRQCVGANYCIDRIYFAGAALCIQNPATGREATMPHTIPKAAGAARRVVVAGGGPGGMEAARVCALRGHDVLLFEAADALGGQVNLAAKATWRESLSGITQWLESQVRKVGVDLRLGTEATAEGVMAERPDIVVVATGGTPNKGAAEGAAHAVTTWDILSGAVQPGDSVLLFDDQAEHQGPSCAEFMAARGSKVEVATPERYLGVEFGGANWPIHMRELYRMGVVMTPDLRLTNVYPEGNRLVAVLRNEYTLAEEERIVDQVVAEHGTLPRDDLYFALKPQSRNLGQVDLDALIAGRPQAVAVKPDGAYQLFRVGDAVASRNIHAAIFDSLRLCKEF
jgi:2,4-dienoyl-CoA reductase-like NADH-dependent reductase (Old Yellow Enzyme family)